MKNKERREVTLQEACIVTKQNTAAVTETEMIPVRTPADELPQKMFPLILTSLLLTDPRWMDLRCVRQISRRLRRNLRQSCQ